MTPTEPTSVSDLSPLAEKRAWASIAIVAEVVASGASALTYSDLARRLGMSKVNGQGLNQYLTHAATICAENGWPNIAVLVVTKDSLDAGAPMPSKGSFSAGFNAATGLNEADIPAEQDRVRGFDWAAADLTPPEESDA